MSVKTIFIIAILFITIGCAKKTATEASQTASVNVDSIKSLILAKENATLDRWYNGDPMGFIDNSWGDVTYFDPSLTSRIDSISAFKEFLTPIIGKVHIPSHEFDKPLVRIFGDIAILTFTDIFSIGEDTVRWHATEIYQQREKDWKLIHSHWTQNVK